MYAKTTIKCFAIGVAALLFMGMSVFAQDSTTSASVAVGGESVSGDYHSSRLQQYEEYPSGLVLFGADLLWNAKSGYYFGFDGTHLGYDDQYGIFTWGKKGVFKLDLTLNDNPRWFSNTGRSFWTETSPGVMNYLGGQLAPVDLRYVREKIGINFDFMGLENWDFKFAYSHETRRGHQPFEVSYPNHFEQASPVDYLTQDYNASANWAKGRWFAGATYTYNDFKNDIPVLYINYPNPPNAASPYKYNMAPDSKAWTMSFNGGVILPYHHRIVGNISWGEITSDRTLFTNLYTPTFNGKIDTLNGQLRLTGDPLNWFGYSATYTRTELDNKSDYYVLGTGSGAYGTRLVGYKKTDWKGEVHFDPIKQVRFGIEYNHLDTDHEFRDFVDTTVKSWKGTLDLNFAPWVSFRASYTDQTQRHGGDNLTAEALMFPADNAGVDWGGTQFDIENRDSKIWNALVIFTPLQDLAISLSYQNNKDDFPDDYFGLRDRKYDNWGIDVNYAWNDRLTLYANYEDEKYDNSMWSQYIDRFTPVADPRNEWGHKYNDDVKTYTVGFDFDAVPGRFDLSSDLAYSKSESASAFTFVPGGNTAGVGTISDGIFAGVQYNAYPLLWSKYTKWTTKLNYHFNKNLSASISYILQKYEGHDWANDIVQPLPPSLEGANLSAWKLLGAIVPDYDANIFQFFVKFSF